MPDARSFSVATDPLSTRTISAEPTSPSSPVIENEFSTYRAISRGAVFAAIFGLLSLFCFADPWSFLAFPVLAIVTGVLADRRIQRFPEILTGRKLAQAGIAMGLCFSLMALTLGTVQRFVYSRSAAKFSEKYVEILQKGTLGDMLWYGINPKSRLETTPEKILEQSRAKAADPEGGGMAEMRNGPYKRIMSRIATGGDQHIEFVRIENVGMNEDKPFAMALFKIHGPVSKEFPEEEQLIGAVLKSLNDGSEFPWWVEEIQFPFKSTDSLAPAPKPVDDGHGHAH
jgi:hypothetical protein